MKTILSAIFTVALVSVLVGAGTFAYYTDSETSVDNTFTSGTMDLYMTNHDEDISAEWTYFNMAPGMDYDTGELNLWNDGTIEADHVEMTFTTICTEMGTEESDTLDGAEGMDEYLQVLYMIYENGDDIEFVSNAFGYTWNTAYIDDANGNGYIDLDDLNGVTFDDLPAPPANHADNYEFRMGVAFHADAGNDYQGDKCELIVDFTLNQDESQTETTSD